MNEPEKIRIKYIFPDDHNPQYINGAYGGIGPRGEFVIHFYMERTPLVKKQSFLLQDGKLGEEILEERDPADHRASLVRFIQSGIIMDYNVAREVHRWLGDKLKEYEGNLTNFEDGRDEDK